MERSGRSSFRRFLRSKAPEQSLSFERCTDFLEGGRDVLLWKPYLAKPENVRELFATLFKYDNRAPQTRGDLERDRLRGSRSYVQSIPRPSADPLQ